MYIYESHMGGFYSSDESLDYEDRYCGQCGDSDYEIGTANTVRDALWLVVDSHYSMECIKEFIDQEFGVNLKVPITDPDATVEIQEEHDKQKAFCHTCGHICSIIADANDWEADLCWDCAELWMNEIEKLNSEDVLNTCYK